MRKAMILIAAGVGYVLGAKAGRRRYDQIRGAAMRVRRDPRVKETAQQAAAVAHDASTSVQAAVADTAAAARAKVAHDG